MVNLESWDIFLQIHVVWYSRCLTNRENISDCRTKCPIFENTHLKPFQWLSKRIVKILQEAMHVGLSDKGKGSVWGGFINFIRKSEIFWHHFVEQGGLGFVLIHVKRDRIWTLRSDNNLSVDYCLYYVTVTYCKHSEIAFTILQMFSASAKIIKPNGEKPNDFESSISQVRILLFRSSCWLYINIKVSHKILQDVHSFKFPCTFLAPCDYAN